MTVDGFIICKWMYFSKGTHNSIRHYSYKLFHIIFNHVLRLCRTKENEAFFKYEHVQFTKYFFLMKTLNAIIYITVSCNCIIVMFPWFFLDDQWKSHSVFPRRQEEDRLCTSIRAGGQWRPQERATTENIWEEPGGGRLGTRAWRERGLDPIKPKDSGVAGTQCYENV